MLSNYIVINLLKKYEMDNCLSKCDNKTFRLHTPTLTSDKGSEWYMKKTMSNILLLIKIKIMDMKNLHRLLKVV